ncbi:MAG: N-acetyltransferase [Kofleriaceae bacterium]|jgi:L-amino acid N-acyltransferase YncA|nr:N-acetyltransferase [Kofleriaceae bacterium]MBP6839060.1 N-acetyltransferase [Kofleriaceae bacterium]MBP9206225.1 N-acetyltransferase [Kofleriaceae bacterium]
MTDWTLTEASLDDAAAVAAIYAHHVLHGAASWEQTAPTTSEMAARMARVLDAGWPWLLAKDQAGATVGYAYAAQFNPRAGYRHTCEDSIYLRHDMVGRGLGTRLLTALMTRCEALGFRQMVAGMSGSEPGSMALHARAGFVEVARMPNVGRKFGRWLDLVYMQRALGPGAGSAPAVEPA